MLRRLAVLNPGFKFNIISRRRGRGAHSRIRDTSTVHNNSKSKIISRRLGGGDEAYFTYVEEADNDANEDSTLNWNCYQGFSK